MLIRKPEYYDAFRCIAGACPDSCCKEWDVQVDETAADYYRSLPGDLGERLRQVLRTEDGETVMTIVDGRCPMWRQDGLCRIQAELGEEALCQVCRDFPRLCHDYGSFRELGLELSCPEAARIIFANPNAGLTCQETEEEAPEEEEEQYMQLLLRSRERAMDLMLDPAYSPEEALMLLLLYGQTVQAALDEEDEEPGDPRETDPESLRTYAKPGDWQGMVDFFRELEILTDAWKQRLDGAKPAPLPEQTRTLARYLIQRYWLQTISDLDLVCRVKFILVSCILIPALGGDYVQTAQLFSKEIENDADNVDALLDGAFTCRAFTDERLLGMLFHI